MYNEDTILTAQDLNNIELKIEELTNRIKLLGATKYELKYNDENITYDNDIIYAISEEE